MLRDKRVLITGVSGLLGSNLARCWKGACEVLGTYNEHPVSLPGVRTETLDILQDGGLRRMVEDFRPDVVVHCAALADIDACEQDRGLALQMNAGMVTRLTGALGQTAAKLVHISTDAIYGGRGPHSEDEPLRTVNYYGHTKYLGEAEALKYPGALIARTAFFGRNIQKKKCFAEFVVSELSQGRRVRGYTDVKTSVLFTLDLASLLEQALAKDLKGVYNFGCRGAMSKHDIAVLIARRFGLDASLIDPVRIEDFPLKAARGKDLELDVSKLARDLGQPPVTMDETIQHFRQAGEAGGLLD